MLPTRPPGFRPPLQPRRARVSGLLSSGASGRERGQQSFSKASVSTVSLPPGRARAARITSYPITSYPSREEEEEEILLFFFPPGHARGEQAGYPSRDALRWHVLVACIEWVWGAITSVFGFEGATACENAGHARAGWAGATSHGSDKAPDTRGSRNPAASER